MIAYPKAWTPGLEGVLKGNAVLMDIKTEADLDAFKGKLKGAIIMAAFVYNAAMRDEKLPRKYFNPNVVQQRRPQL